MEQQIVSRVVDASRALIEDMVRAACAATGCSENIVRQFVEPAGRHLLREYGGERVPKLGKVYPISEIRGALDSGESLRNVCRRYDIGFSTLYRLLDDAPKDRFISDDGT